MKVLREFISVYVVETINMFIRWFIDDGVDMLVRIIVIAYYLLGIAYVGLYVVGLKAGVWVCSKNVFRFILFALMFSVFVDVVSMVYIRLRLMHKHTKLPSSKEELVSMGFDLCNYVLYLKYNSSVEMNVFNYVLLLLGFPLNIFLFCNRVIANEETGVKCDFDFLFAPVLLEVFSPSMSTALELINEVYDNDIDVNEIRSELCMRTYASLKLLHGGVNNRFANMEC